MTSFALSFDVEKIRAILIVFFILVCMCFVLMRSYTGIWSATIRNYFVTTTFIIIGIVSLLRIGTLDFHAIMKTFMIIVPATFVMGILGQWIGSIMDNPKNQEDADYKLSVLNALKNMDKSMTLEDLNEKLTKTVEEPDIPDETEEEAES